MNGLSLELLSHPGETLNEVLESNNMSQKELAARIGISTKHINQIISGQVKISPETAFKLEKVFSLSAGFWNRLQAKYDQEKMEILEKETVSDEEKQLIKNSLYKQLVKFNYLEKESDSIKRVIQLRGFYGVANLFNVPKAINANALFRKSRAIQTDDYALAAWMKICEIETEGIEVSGQLDSKLIKNNLSKIKSLNQNSDPNVIVDSLQRIFAECGVAFSVVKNISGAPVQGFIKRINNKVRLCMTLRNKYSDIFWFTLFHEIGHLLDCKNEFFVDFRKTDDEAEEYADSFATEELLAKNDYEIFVRRKDFSKAEIKRYAWEKGILPGILVGRLQHDGHLPNSHCNDLRTQYVWAD